MSDFFSSNGRARRLIGAFAITGVMTVAGLISSGVIKPSANNGTDLGASDRYFANSYISTSTVAVHSQVGPSAVAEDVFSVGVSSTASISMVSVMNTAPSGEAPICIRKSTNDGSGICLSYTGPNNGAVTSTATLTLFGDRFIALVGEGVPSFGYFSSSRFDVYGGLRISPFYDETIDVGGATTTAITLHNSNTSALDFPAVATQSCEVLTMTVAGATTDSTVLLGGAGLNTLQGTTGISTVQGFASAAGTVTVKACNNTGTGSSDPASVTVRADIWNH